MRGQMCWAEEGGSKGDSTEGKQLWKLRKRSGVRGRWS